MSVRRSSMITALALIACLSSPIPGLIAQPPLNDTCDLAFVNSIILNPGANAGFTNLGATNSGLVPSCWAAFPITPPLAPTDVWFVYGAQATCAVTFTLNAPAILLKALAIYDGNAYAPGSCGLLPELGCDSNSAPITINVNAGDVLFLQVSSLLSTNPGPIAINVQTSFGLSISSPLGAGSLQVDNSCGVAGSSYVTVFTPFPGNFPNGWFFGVDISVPDLVTQVSFGAPFSGNLDGSGGSSWSTPAGIPSGLSIHAVTVTIALSGLPLEASAPVLFITP